MELHAYSVVSHKKPIKKRPQGAKNPAIQILKKGSQGAMIRLSQPHDREDDKIRGMRFIRPI